jgi:hypothetical protein
MAERPDDAHKDFTFVMQWYDGLFCCPHGIKDGLLWMPGGDRENDLMVVFGDADALFHKAPHNASFDFTCSCRECKPRRTHCRSLLYRRETFRLHSRDGEGGMKLCPVCMHRHWSLWCSGGVECKRHMLDCEWRVKQCECGYPTDGKEPVLKRQGYEDFQVAVNETFESCLDRE